MPIQTDIILTQSLSIGRTQLVSGIMVMAQAVTLICCAIMEAWCAITREKIKQLAIFTRVCALVACHKLSTHKTPDRCTMRLKIGFLPRLSASSKSASCSNYLLQTDSLPLNIRLDRNKMEPWVWLHSREEKMVNNSRIKNCRWPMSAPVCWCAQAKVSAFKAEIYLLMRLKLITTAIMPLKNA